MVALAALLVLLLVCCVYYLLAKPHPHFPPGPLRWPIWGGYLQLLLHSYKTPYKAIHWMARRYKTDVLGIYLGPYSTVVACSNASVREMLQRPEFQGRPKSFLAKMRDTDLSIRGQIFIDGHMWSEQRRFMLRTLRDFGYGTRHKHYEGIIEEEIKDFIDLLHTNIKGFSCKQEVEVPTIFYPLFVNLALELLFNVRLPRTLHSTLKEFAFAAIRFQSSLDPTSGMINMTPWVRHFIPGITRYNDFTKANEYTKRFVQEFVKEHKETFLNDNFRDFCDSYLNEIEDNKNNDDQHWFSEEQLVMTLCDILLPSATTVTATLGFAIQLLLHHPEVQDKVYKEIEKVVGRSRLPNLDDRKNLPYLEAVLKEVMRRVPLLPLAQPHLCTEDTYFRGHFIPKDTLMIANIWSCHVDENLWTNPFEFIPERHLEDDGTLKKKDLTLPFGLGKRVCPGETFSRQNMFLVFSTLMQNFALELPEGHFLPDLDSFITGFSITPKPFSVNLVPR